MLKKSRILKIISAFVLLNVIFVLSISIRSSDVSDMNFYDNKESEPLSSELP